MSRTERQKHIARIIFDWLNGPCVVDGEFEQPPYTHNAEPRTLMIGVDGYLDCKLLAKAIDEALR